MDDGCFSRHENEEDPGFLSEMISEESHGSRNVYPARFPLRYILEDRVYHYGQLDADSIMTK